MNLDVIDVIDLFAGPGGWDEGIRPLGLWPLGIEWDDAAIETAQAAGHLRYQADIAQLRPLDFSGARGLIASPPCQGFSMAGKGRGRKDSELLLSMLSLVTDAESLRAAISLLHDEMTDDRSLLVLEPLRWALELTPQWLAWEQVPAVLPIWESCSVILRGAGYSVETRVLNAEQYGVPQTRRRAILVARRDGDARLPEPTHSRYYSRTPAKLDEGVLPWVSMAQALGSAYEGLAVRSNYGTGGDPKQRGTRTVNEPSATITSKAGRNQWVFRNGNQEHSAVRRLDQPAPTIHFAQRQRVVTWEPVLANAGDPAESAAWVHNRPSPTIVGSFAPDVVAAPGYRKPGYGPWQKAVGSVRVTVQEAAVLQSFRADYPWQGSKTAQYRQVGDAVPPLLARHIVETVAVKAKKSDYDLAA